MFNDTSRYLDDIFTIDNPEFEKYIPDIYPAELHQLRLTVYCVLMKFKTALTKQQHKNTIAIDSPFFSLIEF